jgi:pyridoxamine 5'-phosphate oxidase
VIDEPDGHLSEQDADPDPVVQFGRWFELAASRMDAPEAMAVSTVGPDGHPSSRMVLLKSWGDDGFVFFTNYDSRKGRELASAPYAALLFHWEPPARQVRIEGPVVRTDEATSDAYFATRHRGSQIGAHASHQSQPVGTRSELDQRVAALTAEFEGRSVPRPPWWGGQRIVPERFEFWQHRNDRLHDRLVYLPEASGSGWRLERLQP